MPTYNCVTTREDWGCKWYTLHNDPTHASFEFPDTGELEVKFPDGYVTTAQIKTKRELDHVNDMGHESYVSNKRVFAAVPFHGITTLIPIEKVEFRFI